jgi:hypothetical protein
MSGCQGQVAVDSGACCILHLHVDLVLCELCELTRLCGYMKFGGCAYCADRDSRGFAAEDGALQSAAYMLIGI